MFSKSLMVGAMSVVALTLGFSDTAAAQLTATPGSLTYNVSSGSSQVQTLTIQSTTDTSVALTPVYGQGATGWLSINPPNGTNVTGGQSVQFSVTANANPGIPNGTTLTANILATISGQTRLTIPVTLNVGGSTSGTLTANPANLTFTASVAGGTPQSQSVTINNSSQIAATFNVSATSVNSWLAVSTSQGTTGTASATFLVSVNQSLTGLTAGSYDGQINIQSSAGSFSIPVHLTVTSAPTLSVSPTGTLNFFYQFGGGANPPRQTLTLTSSTGSVPFTVSSTASAPGTWLVLNPQGSSATNSAGTSSVSVDINPQNLSPGTYSGTITIGSQVAPNIVIPVNLLVSTNPLLQVNTSSLTYNGSAGGNVPFTSQVTVTSSGSSLSFNAVANSGSAPTTWLSVNPTSGQTGTGTGTLTIKADPSNLPAGTYTGTVNLTSNGAANSPTITVTMTLSNSLLITAAPPALIFNFQTTQGTPLAQTINLTSNGVPQSFTVAATTTNCGNWLSAVAQNFQTPGSITVSVATQQGGFAAGTPCTGTITVTPTSSGLTPLTIPVTLNVSNAALLNVSPTYVPITVQAGQDPSSLPSISLVSTDPISPISYNTAVGPGASWLFVGQGSITPSLLAYQISSRFLSPGNYTGTIAITPTSAGALPVTVTIALSVQSASSIVPTPTSLTFAQAQGAGAPASQTIHLTSGGAGGLLNYSFSSTTSSGASNWLSVSSPSGQTTGATPGDIVVTVNGSTLQQGTYDGIITVVAPSANNTPVQIPVRLVVSAAQALTLSASSLGFNYQIGATSNPSDQTLTITSTGGTAPFTVTKSVLQPVGGSWLTVTPTSGSTSLINGLFTAPVTVSVNPAGLAAGTYNGAVTISSPIASQPITVTVTLTIAGAPIPNIFTILNAGSLQPGPISPGEILTIKGTNLGPATPVNYSLNGSGGLDPKLGGVRVLFDGFPGSPYYVSATQINVIAPYEISGRISTSVTIEFNGQTSATQVYSVAPTTPGIFTLNSSGSGPGAIVNADGSINGPGLSVITAYQTTGAVRGSVVAIFATGYGQSNPPSTTGCFTNPPSVLRRSVFPVTVTLGGITLADPDVQFAGAAPGGPCGFMQINVKVPDNAPLGQNTITFSANGVSSPATVSITVR